MVSEYIGYREEYYKRISERLWETIETTTAFLVIFGLLLSIAGALFHKSVVLGIGLGFIFFAIMLAVSLEFFYLDYARELRHKLAWEMINKNDITKRDYRRK